MADAGAQRKCEANFSEERMGRLPVCAAPDTQLPPAATRAGITPTSPRRGSARAVPAGSKRRPGRKEAPDVWHHHSAQDEGE